MKTIVIRKDFGVYDISDEEDVSVIIDKIIIGSDCGVHLDLSGCLIDYPATSRLIDTIIKQLSTTTGNKKLEIVTDFILPMPTIVNWLFLGSEQLGMELKKGQNYDDVIKSAGSCLSELGIQVSISINDKQGNLVNGVTIPE